MSDSHGPVCGSDKQWCTIGMPVHDRQWIKCMSRSGNYLLLSFFIQMAETPNSCIHTCTPGTFIQDTIYRCTNDILCKQ